MHIRQSLQDLKPVIDRLETGDDKAFIGQSTPVASLAATETVPQVELHAASAIGFVRTQPEGKQMMKSAVALVLSFSFIASTTAFAKCPAGKITCVQWCAKYRSTGGTCMTGHPNSCDKKPQGGATCVDDHNRF
jgi:hypothetical protein